MAGSQAEPEKCELGLGGRILALIRIDRECVESREARRRALTQTGDALASGEEVRASSL